MSIIGNFLRGIPSISSIPEAQRRTYTAETAYNFRLVAKLLQSHSSHTLTSNELVPTALQLELSEIGQFAELAHGTLSPSFIWPNISRLSQPGFPLHGYYALLDSVHIATFHGTVAYLQGYIAYRPQTRQLVVAFSGTSSPGQGIRNFDVRLVAYPGADGCALHTGFWHMYKGVRSRALEELTRAQSDHAVDELCLTGHSLGAVMCYLLALDLMSGSGGVSETQLPLKLALFGSPRIGNSALALRWQTIVADRIIRGLPVSEFSVKGYNDGQSYIYSFVTGMLITSSCCRRTFNPTLSSRLSAFCPKAFIFCSWPPLLHSCCRIRVLMLSGCSKHFWR